MKQYTTFLLLILLAFACHAQHRCDLLKSYDAIFRAEIYKDGERMLVLQRIDSLPPDHCLAGLVNANIWHLDYLKTHFSQIDEAPLLQWSDDSLKLQKHFIAALQKDATFKALMEDFAARYLNPAVIPKDTFKIDKVINIATKFFYIQKITPEGNFKTKVCVGLNGIKDTDEKRYPQVEAFCFQAVFGNLQNPTYKLYDEFIQNVKQVGKMSLGITPQERLLRAQGGIYLLMMTYPGLRTVLTDEYHLRSAYLPFVIKF